MEFDLKKALKKYNRMRSRRRFAAFAAVPVSIAVAWFYDFGRTDTLIRVAIGMVLWGMAETELRLKTIQVRLAEMDDKLQRLTGDGHSNDDLLLEFNDW